MKKLTGYATSALSYILGTLFALWLLLGLFILIAKLCCGIFPEVYYIPLVINIAVTAMTMFNLWRGRDDVELIRLREQGKVNDLAIQGLMRHIEKLESNKTKT